MDKGGPAEVVDFVIKYFGLKKPVIIGYDWGAAIALKMSIKDSRKFSKIIAFHPSFNEEFKDELKGLKTLTLIQWVKQDQFHPWNKWQALAYKIPNVSVEMFEIKPYK